jgi:hypothetical protein
MSSPAGSPSTAATTSRPRRIATLIRWALPLTTLALIPKCPACVAAYVLLFTGIGLSIRAAAATRWILIALSMAALTCLFVRSARRLLVRLK